MRPKLTTLTCRKCKECLPREAFDPSYDKGGNSRGLQLRCRLCQEKPSLLQKLTARVRVDSGGCWIWTGVIANTGYGHWSAGGRIYGVHRLMFSLCRGAIPEGLCVLHRCDVRACCNPDHLFLGTKGDNARDCAEKGRTVNRQGEKHHGNVLSAVQVAEIRARYTGARGQQAALAREFGVRRSTIGAIVRRVSWSHLP